MSSSFRTTIAWGLPWFEFESLTTLDCEAHDTEDALGRAFRNADLTTFAIPEKEFDEASNSTTYPRAVYFTRNVLHSNFLIHEGDKFRLGEPDSLFQLIGAREDETDKHIAFYPDCYHAGLWRRSDDELDLALHYWWEKNGSRSGETDNSTHVHYVRYGHGPWRTALMTNNGKPVDWVPPHELGDHPDIVPRVPLEIRWYLSKLGILDEAGINRLRPLTARWIAY